MTIDERAEQLTRAVLNGFFNTSIGSCRCMYSDSQCPAGHAWRYSVTHIHAGVSDHADHSASKCSLCNVVAELEHKMKKPKKKPKKPMKKGSTVIKIYPDTHKPKWLKIGARVHCLGEAQEVFTVYDISAGTSSSMLLRLDGYAHGRESWSKLSQAGFHP